MFKDQISLRLPSMRVALHYTENLLALHGNLAKASYRLQ